MGTITIGPNERLRAEEASMKWSDNKLLITALTSLPVVGVFFGYRYWMRRRYRQQWIKADPREIYAMLTGSEAPKDKVFTEDEIEDMIDRIVGEEVPFWGINYVSTAPQVAGIIDVSEETTEDEGEES